MTEYNVKVQLYAKTYNFKCSDDQDLITASKYQGIDLPNSCSSGVCTSCAARIIDGLVEQEDAMGLNEELREKGYALLCVAYPRSDLNIIVGDEIEESLYNDQFGKYQQ